MGLGDDIMAVGAAEVLHRESGRKIAIGRSVRSLDHSPMELHCPWVVQKGESTKDAVLLQNCIGRRPYLTVKQPRERQVLDPGFRPKAGKLFFSGEEKDRARRHGSSDCVVFDPHTKGGFIWEENKRWPWGHWVDLVAMLQDAGREVLQVSQPDKEILPGVRRANTTTAREALCVVSMADTVITTEGLFHHATPGMEGLRSVVLWGDRTNPAIMGYDGQIDVQSPQHSGEVDGLYCGARYRCVHCIEGMAAITPEMVFQGATAAP